MTFFGGQMTLIGGAGLLIYMISRIVSIYILHEHEFTQVNFTFKSDEMNELGVNFGRYNNSINFITGLTTLPDDGSFDILNNPYVDFLGL